MMVLALAGVAKADKFDEMYAEIMAEKAAGGARRTKPVYPAGFKISPKFTYDSSCKDFRSMLEKKIASAVARLQDCLNYAFVRKDIAVRMKSTLESELPVRIYCLEPPRSIWCAAGGLGQVWFSPSRMLPVDSFCHFDIESRIIHEVAHAANLQYSADHNEQGDTMTDRDEVFSLTNYCMRNARMWLGRARRTADVVEPSRLECMRTYQERTPSTLDDPFWGPYVKMFDEGRDPCTSEGMYESAATPAPRDNRKGH
jgi:hypothetical protein